MPMVLRQRLVTLRDKYMSDLQLKGFGTTRSSSRLKSTTTALTRSSQPTKARLWATWTSLCAHRSSLCHHGIHFWPQIQSRSPIVATRHSRRAQRFPKACQGTHRGLGCPTRSAYTAISAAHESTPKDRRRPQDPAVASVPVQAAASSSVGSSPRLVTVALLEIG